MIAKRFIPHISSAGGGDGGPKALTLEGDVCTQDLRGGEEEIKKRGRGGEQRGEKEEAKKQTNRRNESEKKNDQFESESLSEALLSSRPHVSSASSFFVFFFAPAKVSRVGSSGKGKR